LKLPLIRPCIALIDIGLPRMDGMSLMKELRQHEELENTLFIALTGYGQDHEHAAIMDSGFDHHLVKPLDMGDLLKIVANHTWE
jgi:DNA-binding response OmpR family regulator